MIREEASPVHGGARAAARAGVRRVEAVVNPLSGSVEPGAAEALQAMLDDYGLEARVVSAEHGGLPDAVAAAVEAAPDLLVVLAGDGTARLAAELCGHDGPLLAPLPGGTMNMLPKALYGERDWREALTAALEEGEVRHVSGGEIAGRSFYVAAILGAPALWADAREAVREMKWRLALLRAHRACRRAFAGRLRFALDGGAPRKAEALTLMCPLVSRAMKSEEALEADALDPHGVAEAFRLGLKAAFGGALGDWRRDPSVTTAKAQKGRAWANGRIPAILDGEPHRFDRGVEFRFLPDAFKVLAPRIEPPPESPEEVISDSVRAAM
jgi:diacylglycerol kinase family enzyme